MTNTLPSRPTANRLDGGGCGGGAIECAALAVALKTRIKIFGRPSRGQGYVEQADFSSKYWKSGKPIVRLLREGNHYDLLVGVGQAAGKAWLDPLQTNGTEKDPSRAPLLENTVTVFSGPTSVTTSF